MREPTDQQRVRFEGQVAVCINQAFYHLGLYHAIDEQTICQFHLAWHQDLKREEINGEFRAWSVPPLPRFRAPQVAAFCRLVFNRIKKGQMAYAFSSPVGALSKSGALKEGVLGLTCASFVLAVFEAVGVDLVEYLPWEKGPKDEAWQHWITKEIGKDDAGHAQRLAEQIPALRYQPYQVFGASLAGSIPVDFEEAEALGVRAREIVNSWS